MHKKRHPKLFLSYSSRDFAFAEKLTNHLARLGIDVWWDDWELTGGEDIWRRIHEAVTRSRNVGVVLSPRFLKSDHCQRELKIALDRKRPLIPILHKRAQLPPSLNRLKHFDFTGGHYYSSLAELGGKLYDFSPKRLRTSLRQDPPRSFQAVARLFERLGWDGYELMEEGDFRKLARLKGVDVVGGKLEYYPDEVLKRNSSLSPELKKLVRG